MANILYTYENHVYANITNRCDCNCRFCIRSHGSGVGDAETLWHQKEPSLPEILAAIDAFDFTGYTELVYCGYGEPTCALDNLIASAKYAKEAYGLSIRLNTNGLGCRYHQKDIVPQLASVVDTISISLNAPDAESYNYISRPAYPDAYEHLTAFIKACRKEIPEVKVTVVDVISEAQIEACRSLAKEMGVKFRVRVNITG